jgi:hypothetical protein
MRRGGVVLEGFLLFHVSMISKHSSASCAADVEADVSVLEPARGGELVSMPAISDRRTSRRIT